MLCEAQGRSIANVGWGCGVKVILLGEGRGGELRYDMLFSDTVALLLFSFLFFSFRFCFLLLPFVFETNEEKLI